MKFYALLIILFGPSFAQANTWLEAADRAAGASMILDEALDLAENLGGSEVSGSTLSQAQNGLRRAQENMRDAKDLSDSLASIMEDDSTEGSDLLTSMRKVNYKLRKIRDIKNLIIRFAGTKTDVVVASQTMEMNATLSEIHKELTLARKDRIQARQEKNQLKLEELKKERDENEFFAAQEKLMQSRNQKIAKFNLSGVKFDKPKSSRVSAF